MDLAKAMDQLGAQLKKIPNTNVYDYPPDSIQPPAIVVSWPEDASSFDVAYRRGSDRIVIPVIVAVPNPYDRVTKPLMARYCDTSGEYSVKTCLERSDAVYTEFDKTSLVVRWPRFEVYPIAAIDHLTALFPVEFNGKGV